MLRKVFNWGFPVLLYFLVGFCVARTDLWAWANFLGATLGIIVLFGSIILWVVSVSFDGEKDKYVKKTD